MACIAEQLGQGPVMSSIFCHVQLSFLLGSLLYDTECRETRGNENRTDPPCLPDDHTVTHYLTNN